MSEPAEIDLELPELPDPGDPFLILKAAGRWFGVPLDRVLEVVTARAYTRLPGAVDAVLGLINLRGRVVTVVDLGAALRLNVGPGPARRVAVVEHAGKRVGIAVEDTTRIAHVRPEALSPAGGERPEFPIAATGEVNGRALAVLDTDALLAGALA
jgi:purine-binding chemotaxis protein CheW